LEVDVPAVVPETALCTVEVPEVRVVPLAVEHPVSPSAAIRVTEVTVLSIEFFIPPIFRQLAKPQLCSGFFCAMS